MLLSAPTGSGKTLAAFLFAIDWLVREAARGALPAGTSILYVSPLRALSNDVARNLEVPLQGIAEVARREGAQPPAIRTFVRTGDTEAKARARMVREPPHIVVTTPESLHILLCSQGGRRHLSTVRWVIVDEIHALYGNKRGSHLALSLERLERLCRTEGPGPPRRLALSATVEPLDAVGSFLVGAGRPPPVVVEVGRTRPLDLEVLVPDEELSAVASGVVHKQVLDRVAELARAHRSTLVFANTRRQVERFAHLLRERLAPLDVGAHHGSLGREKRLEMESRLKAGALSVMVASSSLELGIDIGDVDLVVQIDSPRSVGAFLQRLGRSRHQVGGIPKARLLPMTRDGLVECAALVACARAGEVDTLVLPEAPLDVLAQCIVAEVSCGPISVAELRALVRNAWPYRALDDRRFEQVIDLHSEGVALRWGRSGAFLHHDREAGMLRPRRGAGLVAMTSGGAIPDRADYQVVLDPEGATLGTLDEDFAIESMSGDVILLGNQSWRITRVEPGRVRVVDAAGQSPTVPFWLGDGPGRTPILSAQVSAIRARAERVFEGGEEDAAFEAWLVERCSVEPWGATQIVRYLRAGWEALGGLPTTDCVVAERFFDEAGGMQLVLHAPFGARLNRIWGLALRKRFCKSFDFELQAAATDEGILLSLGPQHSFPMADIWAFLHPSTVEEVALQAVLTSQFFPARWRWAATRSLAVPRWSGGRKLPPPLLRMRCDDLMAAVFPAALACQEGQPPPIEAPDHPLVREALRECLEDGFDLRGLVTVLGRLRGGTLRVLEIETKEPSPLCHALLNAAPYAFLDDAPLEERRSRAVAVRRTLDGRWGDLGQLDTAVIDEVAAEVAPLVRSADELHDALSSLVRVPAGVALQWFVPGGVELHAAALRSEGRLRLDAGGRWFVGERTFDVAAIAGPEDGRDGATDRLVRHWVQSLGPFEVRQLAARIEIPTADLEASLVRLEGEGLVLAGQYDPRLPAGRQWCERRVLARIHRRCLDRLRRAVEAVPPAAYQRFLLRWMGLHPSERRAGLGGVLRTVEQLGGWHAAAVAWEPELLAPRVRNFEGRHLDELCFRGQICWGRMAPRDTSTFVRHAAITIVPRAELGCWRTPGSWDEGGLSPAAADVLAALRRRGASFPDELPEASRRLPAEVEAALGELVAQGFATADGFSALRALLRPPSTGRERRGARAGRGAPKGRLWRAAGGRWTQIVSTEAAPDAEGVARALVARWGVVLRDVVAREALAVPWREVLGALRVLEMRGEIRGGRFVQGPVGEQFADPAAVESLRAERNRTEGEPIAVAACDPANLVGVFDGLARVPALAGHRVLYDAGVAVAHWDGKVERKLKADVEVPPRWWVPEPRSDGRMEGPERVAGVRHGVARPAPVSEARATSGPG